MNTDNFCYWLWSTIELKFLDRAPTQEEWDVIKEHLALVFKKETSPLKPSSETYREAEPWERKCNWPEPSIELSICGSEPWPMKPDCCGEPNFGGGVTPSHKKYSLEEFIKDFYAGERP